MTPQDAAIIRSPDLFPHSYDPAGDRVLIARLSEKDISAASFLDQRLLTPQLPSEWIGWPRISAAFEASRPPENLGFVFHLGHVGSTLLARLLGGHQSVLSLREPAALRALATLHADIGAPESLFGEDQFEARIALFLGLWSRPFRAGQLPIVKATSFCAEMAADLMARPSAPRAIFITARPEPYLATILGGENNHLDIRANAPGRLKRLHARVGEAPWRLAELSYGEQVAMSWIAEMAALKAADGARVQWLDFDDLLADPQGRLAAAFAHFDRPVTPGDVAALAAGPDMRRYAKAPEHAYDAALRKAVLDQARGMHGAEIRRGLAWIEAFEARWPGVVS